MGMFDTVLVPCPNCGKKEEFQSKSGDCILQLVELDKCPDDIFADINRHSPYTCECGCKFRVDEISREVVEV
jgi:RNase P subunit RPR2